MAALFLDAQGQVTLWFVVGSGQISNSFKLFCMSLLPASMKRIRSKTAYKISFLLTMKASNNVAVIGHAALERWTGDDGRTPDDVYTKSSLCEPQCLGELKC